MRYYDPQQIRNAADNFFMAAGRCLEKKQVSENQINWLPIPAVVCMALGIELCLKATITLEKNETPKGHELLDLFKDLSPQSKEALSARLSLQEAELKQRIASVSNTFEKWRYFYEEKSLNADLEFLHQFAIVAASLFDSPAINSR